MLDRIRAKLGGQPKQTTPQPPAEEVLKEKGIKIKHLKPEYQTERLTVRKYHSNEAAWYARDIISDNNDIPLDLIEVKDVDCVAAYPYMSIHEVTVRYMDRITVGATLSSSPSSIQSVSKAIELFLKEAIGPYNYKLLGFSLNDKENAIEFTFKPTKR